MKMISSAKVKNPNQLSLSIDSELMTLIKPSDPKWLVALKEIWRMPLSEVNNYGHTELERAHIYLLEKSMDILVEDSSLDEDINDVLEWIYSPDYIEKIALLPDGRKGLIRRHQYDITFSFLNCCRIAGLRDPDVIRKNLPDYLSYNRGDRIIDNFKTIH